MTVIEAIKKIDEFYPNTLAFNVKLQWLQSFDEKLLNCFLSKYIGNEDIIIPDYAVNNDAFLLISKPFDDIYLTYISMLIYYHDNNINAYNNSSELFFLKFSKFKDSYNRNHKIKETFINLE